MSRPFGENEKMGNKIQAQSFLSGRALIVAANRGPVTFEVAEDGHLEPQRGEGGLVTALTGLYRQSDGVWIACARTEADAAWRSGIVTMAEDCQIGMRFLSPEPAAVVDRAGGHRRLVALAIGGASGVEPVVRMEGRKMIDRYCISHHIAGQV